MKKRTVSIFAVGLLVAISTAWSQVSIGDNSGNSGEGASDQSRQSNSAEVPNSVEFGELRQAITQSQFDKALGLLGEIVKTRPKSVSKKSLGILQDTLGSSDISKEVKLQLLDLTLGTSGASDKKKAAESDGAEGLFGVRSSTFGNVGSVLDADATPNAGHSAGFEPADESGVAGAGAGVEAGDRSKARRRNKSRRGDAKSDAGESSAAGDYAAGGYGGASYGGGGGGDGAEGGNGDGYGGYGAAGGYGGGYGGYGGAGGYGGGYGADSGYGGYGAAAGMDTGGGGYGGMADPGAAREERISRLRNALRKASGTERKKITATIRKLLNEQFDARTVERKRQLASLQRRLSQLQRQLEERSKSKEEVIDIRLKKYIIEAKGIGF